MNDRWKKVTLIRSFDLSTDIRGLQFKGSNLQKHVPGQFYLINISDNPSQHIAREYSLSNAPSENNLIEFGIQKVTHGVVSNFLYNLKEGQQIGIKGPMGQYFNWDFAHTGHVLFIAGGSGIVPFMSMLRMNPKNEITLLASFKTKKQFAYFEELNSHKGIKKFHFVPTLSQEKWNGRMGRIDKQLLFSALKKDTRIFICGRSEFVESIYTMLIELHVPEIIIQRERFG